jgi:3-oxoacyl-[acyl-carrier protein] reductase
VVVNDLHAEAASAVVDEVAGTGRQAEPAPGDMTDPHEVEHLFDQVIAAHGGIDIAVNNVVGLFEFSDILDPDVQRWQHCLDHNLLSTYMCSRRAAVEMRKRTGGSIVNISSGAGKLGSTLAGGYGAAKAAVIRLTRSLAAELAPAIRFNCVWPGLVETDMNARFTARAAEAEGISTDEFATRRVESIPLKRLASPDDVAHAVAFLASRQAAYTTGEALNVSGGLVML